MAICDLVVAEAEKWIGYLEKRSNSQLESMTANAGSANYTIFAKWYLDWFGENFQAQPWCAMFASDMLYIGCGKREIVPHFAYCPYGVNWFKQNGYWITKNPRRGDVIFFKDSSGVACHVGLVSSVSSSTVVTIEGNTSGGSTVISNGGGVCKKTYPIGYNRILGYGRPPYPTESQEDDDMMTQEQFNAMMNTYLESLAKQNPSDWSQDDREWAESCGLIKGDGDGNKQYMAFTTREQMVTFMHRLYDMLH